MIKVWISKYALTTGLHEVEIDVYPDNGIVSVRNKDSMFYTQYYHGEGKDWHKTKEEAIKKAEKMKSRKIESLKKQLEKLENMKFD